MIYLVGAVVVGLWWGPYWGIAAFIIWALVEWSLKEKVQD